MLVGACGLGRRPSGAVEMGYWIAREHWNRGFATEAGLALLAIAEALGLVRLEASYFIDNPASGRVLEKLGFLADRNRRPPLQLRARRRGDGEIVLEVTRRRAGKDRGVRAPPP